MDIRIRKLAQQTVRYSLGVKPGTNVIISGGEEAKEFIWQWDIIKLFSNYNINFLS